MKNSSNSPTPTPGAYSNCARFPDDTNFWHNWNTHDDRVVAVRHAGTKAESRLFKVGHAFVVVTRTVCLMAKRLSHAQGVRWASKETALFEDGTEFDIEKAEDVQMGNNRADRDLPAGHLYHDRKGFVLVVERVAQGDRVVRSRESIGKAFPSLRTARNAPQETLTGSAISR